MLMGGVIAELTMSLDGFIAGPNDEVDPLFDWYMSGDVEFPIPGASRAFRISQASADVLNDLWGSFGAIVTGRRDFDVSRAWGGRALRGLPMFIVTHHPPPEWVKEGSPFTFVTDGVESAIAQAKAVVGDKHVAVGGSQIIQQCIRAGLLDEIQIDLAPVLLGSGIRLFDNIGTQPIHLEKTQVVNAPDVTHLRYRFVK
jgi:dihydrofolate reductase